MAVSVKNQLAFEALTESFLHPLLVGEEVHLHRPIGPGALSYFVNASMSDSEVKQTIYEAFVTHACEIVPTRRVDLSDAGTMAMVMAAHNLTAVTDPKMDRIFARRARKVILQWHDQLLEEAGTPKSRTAALMRHTLMCRLLSLRRNDVVVKNWAYTYRFFGRPVPGNVVALPKLRMVRQFPTETSLEAVWTQTEDIDHLPLHLAVRRLIQRSPISEILLPEEVPNLHFGLSHLAVLSDHRLRSGIAQAVLRTGLSSKASRVGAAVAELQSAPGGLLYVALAFAIELLLGDTLDRGFVLDKDPLRKPQSEGAELFAALLPVVMAGPLALRPLLEFPPSDMELLRCRAAGIQATATSQAMERAKSMLTRAFHPPVELETGT